MNIKVILALMILFVPFSGSNAASANPLSYSGLENPCKEGQFLDVQNNQCKKLARPDFGFSFNVFSAALPELTINVTSCKESDLLNAVDKINKNGGGTINLGACTYNMTSLITINSNTLLQGKGSERTKLVHYNNNDRSSIIKVNRKSKNIIIRDLYLYGRSKIQPSDVRTKGILADWTKNLLVERVKIENSNHSLMLARSSQNVTWRYIRGINSGIHGLGADSCVVKISQDTNKDGVVSMSECDNGDQDQWPSHFSIYSNHISGMRYYAIDVHGMYTEYAGNKIVNNGYAQKNAYPSRYVWFHDNYIAENDYFLAAFTGDCGIVDESMQVHDHVYYNNTILKNGHGGEYHSGIKNGLWFGLAKNMILINNKFVDNAKDNTWNIHSSCNTVNPVKVLKTTAFYCPKGDLTSANVIGNGTAQEISGLKCDLDKVATIFGGTYTEPEITTVTAPEPVPEPEPVPAPVIETTISTEPLPVFSESKNLTLEQLLQRIGTIQKEQIKLLGQVQQLTE